MDFQAKLDGVICIAALEHVCPKDWLGILARFQMALRAPNKTLFVRYQRVCHAPIGPGLGVLLGFLRHSSIFLLDQLMYLSKFTVEGAFIFHLQAGKSCSPDEGFIRGSR